MKKTIVYIDAFNLYYGLLKGTANKWLDPVLVFNPQPHVCVELKRFASYYRNIARDIPARCQLPFEVKDGVRTIHCPEVWRYDKQALKTERPRCPKTPVTDQIRLELALASLFMELSCEDDAILELLRQRDLLKDGRLTAEGKSAALRVMRKYGILTRLASVGHNQPK